MAETFVLVARTPRAIVQHFTTHAADAPERAMGFNPTQESETRLFTRLQAEGLIRQASPSLFYVDRDKLAARREGALVRVLSVGAVVGGLAAGVALLRSVRRRHERADVQAASLN